MSANLQLISPSRDEDDLIIERAAGILACRLGRERIALGSSETVERFLTFTLGQLEHEVFAVLWLDVRGRLIAYEQMFRGSLTHTSVHPREVVKAALRHNAASVILAHNHPSGDTEPSQPDLLLTTRLAEALGLVEVRVLDHVIVAGTGAMSFAERGMI